MDMLHYLAWNVLLFFLHSLSSQHLNWIRNWWVLAFVHFHHCSTLNCPFRQYIVAWIIKAYLKQCHYSDPLRWIYSFPTLPKLRSLTPQPRISQWPWASTLLYFTWQNSSGLATLDLHMLHPIIWFPYKPFIPAPQAIIHHKNPTVLD